MPPSPAVPRAHHFPGLSRSITLGTCLVVLLGTMAPAFGQVGSPSSCTPDEALVQNYVTAHNDAAARGGFFGKTTTMAEARQYFHEAQKHYQYQSIKELQAYIDRDAGYVRQNQGSSDLNKRSVAAQTAVRNKLLECRIAELQGGAAQPLAGTKVSAPPGAKAAGAMVPASAQVGGPSSCVPDEGLLQNYVTARNAVEKGPFGYPTTMEKARQDFGRVLAGFNNYSIQQLQAVISGDAARVREIQGSSGSSDPQVRRTVAGLRVQDKLLECRIAELQAGAAPPAGTQASAPSSANAAGGSAATPGTGGSAAAGNEQAARQVTVAGSGRSAMHCVRLVRVAPGSSGVSGSNRVLSNGCEDAVEVTWCVGAECAQNRGGMWTIQPGRSWPIPGTGEVRWAACHGVNTVHFRKGSQGTRYYCTEPAKP